MLRRFCDLVVRAEPLLLLLLIPAVPVPQKLLYLGLLALPIVWLCAGYTRGHLIPRTPLDWAMALLLAMIGISQLVAWDPVYSLPKVTFAVWGVAAYYAVVRMGASRRGLQIAMGLFLGLGAWIAFLSMFAAITITQKVPWLAAIATEIPKLVTLWWGFNLNPNPAAGALVLFVPVQGLLFWRSLRQLGGGQGGVGRTAGLVAQGLAFLVTAGALVLTQTRSAWLGLVVAGLALAAWRLPTRFQWLGAVLVVGTCLVAIAGPHLIASVDYKPPAELASLDAESTLWRQAIWADVIPAIRDYPLTGLGIVRLWDRLATLYPPESLSPITLSKKEAHNIYLEVAVSFGLPGLIGLLGGWVGAGWAAVRARAAAHEATWERTLVEGLAAGLLAHFIFGMSDSIVFNGKVGISLWLALGLLVAACLSILPAKSSERELMAEARSGQALARRAC